MLLAKQVHSGNESVWIVSFFSSVSLNLEMVDSHKEVRIFEKVPILGITIIRKAITDLEFDYRG